MAWGEYKNSGRCLGKMLYQLSQIGIPMTIVSDVQLVDFGTLNYGGRLFATVDWDDQDTPIFNFAEPLYNAAQQVHNEREGK